MMVVLVFAIRNKLDFLDSYVINSGTFSHEAVFCMAVKSKESTEKKAYSATRPTL